ncbi:response regulator [Rugamonas sp. DEMB1]|uniref:ATP-binding response regulator n=1 Tax=Rugamonas sp. DEMB1 TaxID=3039386 RepID=UPI00244C89C3|nr:response regulator [Rugamonas sp. DEMB1]WGG48753.1 response regulator [Rugamonas sp. DEMB1]
MQDAEKKIRVLVVEDEIVVSEDLQQRLVELGFDVAGAADTGAEAVAFAEATRPDVALMDIMLHGKPEGIEAATVLRDDLNIPVIYLTAHSDAATLRKAKLTDPAGYIVKPFDDAQLRVALELAPARHAMEQRARQAARWLSATLSSVGDAVIATNMRAEITLLNPAAEKMTGWTQDEAAGKPCAQVLRLKHHDTGALLEDPATRALRDGVVVRLDPDTVLVARSGAECFVDDSASPITDETGMTLGAVVVLVDATDRAHAHSRVQALTRQVAELMAEKDKHEAVSAELEAFAAAISHDLRGPLAAISGFSYLLAERHRERLDSSGQKFIDYVRTSALQMERMVEDYLAFLKSNREHVLTMEPVDLRAAWRWPSSPPWPACRVRAPPTSCAVNCRRHGATRACCARC